MKWIGIVTAYFVIGALVYGAAEYIDNFPKLRSSNPDYTALGPVLFLWPLVVVAAVVWVAWQALKYPTTLAHRIAQSRYEQRIARERELAEVEREVDKLLREG